MQRLRQEWPCGRTATEWLKDYLRGRPASASPVIYDRLLAVCYEGGESINDRLVREGWALDYRKYSTDHLEAEAEAKRRGAGVWRGQFMPPWQWRSERR